MISMIPHVLFLWHMYVHLSRPSPFPETNPLRLSPAPQYFNLTHGFFSFMDPGSFSRQLLFVLNHVLAALSLYIQNCPIASTFSQLWKALNKWIEDDKISVTLHLSSTLTSFPQSSSCPSRRCSQTFSTISSPAPLSNPGCFAAATVSLCPLGFLVF